MLTLDNLALQVPPSTRFHGDRANEAYPWHGLVSREASAWPQAARRHMGSAVPAVGPPGRDAGEILPVAPPGCALSDLAVVAAQRLARQGGAAVLARARHLVVAHATLSERMAESTACRVQHALQLDALVPFAISQCGPLGLYAALPVLEGLLAEGEHALLVAADKTLYPFHRVHPGLVQYADAGGAAVVRRHPPGDPGPDPVAHPASRANGRAQVLGHAIVFGSAGARPRTPAARAARSAELLDLTARAVTAAMARAGTTRADVDRYVPASFLPPFRTALARRLGFEADPQAPAGARAHLASAEPLAALASALTSLSPGAQRTVLLCDNAVCGMAGALIAQASSTGRRVRGPCPSPARMSNYRVSLRELRFFLWELHAIEPRVLSQAPYLGIDRARVDRLLDDASAFAHALGECNPAGDREGCRLDATGAVQVPASYGPLWERLRRDWATLLVGGRLAPTRDPARAIPVVADVAEPGVVPPLLAQVVCEMFMGANPSFMTYGGFNRAAVKLLRLHGTPAQRDWIDPLSTWRWDACFCATEAQAGSDLSAVTTRARALPDGSYALRGEKLYVSAGRHDLTENTLYVVLGRVDTAPSDGFSLSCFIVPRLNFDSGAAPVSNHVDCVALPRKMGLNGCANAHLVFGAKGTTRAYLLGNRHNVALLQLRPLMNQARTGSAMFGVGVASSSYLHAAAYARSRIQGRPIERAADARAARVALVEHGDVQRMLLDMKSRVEGCRGLLGKLSAAVTQASILEADPDADPAAAERCRKLAGLLTPVCKAFISDESWHVCTQAVQVHGGRGYTDACPVEQNSRDVRILSIWEGTNYVQSQDLVRDKLGFGRHAILMRYFREALDASLAQRAANAADPVFACWFAQLRAAAEALERSLACLGAAVQAGAMAASSQFFTRFLAMFGMTGAAWALLEAACVAQPRLADPHVAKNREEAAFYRGKLKSAGHYYANILPLVHTHAAAIAAIGDAAWTASADELVSP